MGSFISAPPREQVHVVTSVWGSLTGPTSASTRTRLWLLLDGGDPARPIARICRNDPKTGVPYYTELGPVRSARSSFKRLEFTTVSDQTYVLIEAPCVCGAGAAGMAGPVAGRYENVRVRTDQLDWLEVIG
jgi:hypothetical protein